MDVLGEVRRLGGVARTVELASAGVGRGALHAAVSRGEVWRPRKGWYADPALGADAARALRVGGSLACVSALARRGVWAPEHARLHVAVQSSASRLRHPVDRRRRLADESDPTVVVHWAPASRRGIDDVLTALADASRCCPRQEFFAALESALHQRLLDRTGLNRLRSLVPARRRRLVDIASPLSETGTESVLRLALMELGIAFRQQVRVPGVGRVDFVLGDWLIVEVDSRAHHSDPTEDRRRDTAASIAGYRTLRFMYSQIRHDLPTVIRAIRSARARGDHRRTVVLQEIR